MYFDEYSLRGYASSGDDGRSEIWNYYWSFIKDHFFGGMESLYYMLTLIPCCQIMLIILFYKVLLIMEF